MHASAQPLHPIAWGSTPAQSHLADLAVLELATADDLASGTAAVAELIRQAAGAARVEWWAPDEDGEPELVAAAGAGRGIRQEHSISRGGVVRVLGGRLGAVQASELAPLMTILRRRRAEERLAGTVAAFAHANATLEDFAALVAHELKGPLLAARTAADPSGSIEQALDLVDSLLDAARVDLSATSRVGDALDEALRDLGPAGVLVTARGDGELPVPAGQLRIVLRNLLKNAAAAGARHVEVTAEGSPRSWRLHVDDDGAGLDAGDDYAAGSGVGLTLCRRIAARFGAALELSPRASGGTRATLRLVEVSP